MPKKAFRPITNKKATDEIREKEKETQKMYNHVVREIKAELIREEVTNLTPHEVIERFLDSGGLAFIGGAAGSTAFVTADDLTANRIIAKVVNVFDPGKNNSILNDLTNLVVGDLLYKAISTVSEGEVEDALQRKMEGVSVYFDTGVLFRALGYFGRVRENAAIEFLDICKATGCTLKVFDHTVDEIVDGLIAVASRLHAGSFAFGPIVSYAIEQGISGADLIEASQRVTDELIGLGITIVAAPPIDREMSVDEINLEWQIETDVKQNNPTARVRDVKSLTAIYRLRGGQRQRYLEKCKAIFVTSNASLANVSTRYFRDLFRERGESNIVQICMTDVILTTRLWLKVATQFQDIPRNQLISHAISNLRPSEMVLHRFLDLLKNMVREGRISEEAALKIQFSQFINGLVSLEAENNILNLNEEAAKSIVQNVIYLQKKEIESIRHKVEQNATRHIETALAEERRRYEEQLQRLKKEKEEISAGLQIGMDEVSRLQREIDGLRFMRDFGRRIARRTTRGLSAISLFVIICGTGVTAIWAFFPGLGGLGGAVVVTAAALGLTVLTLLGFGHRDAWLAVEGRLEPFIERWLRRLSR